MPNKSWYSFGCSVIGANHLQDNKPNQDSFKCENMNNSEATVMLRSITAVSDGHGGIRYIRSDKGAKYAVTKMCDAILGNTQIPTTKKSFLIEKILPQISAHFYTKWCDSVDYDFKRNPFADTEINQIKSKYGEDAVKELLSNVKIAYGCTLLTIIAYDDILITMQYGDGDILFLFDNGSVKKISVSSIGDDTDSLCKFNINDMKYNVFVGSEIPILATLSTDGVKNSFPSSDDFLEIPKILKNEIANEGLYKARMKLKNFLTKTTNDGSGDDVTLTTIFRSDIVHPQGMQI